MGITIPGSNALSIRCDWSSAELRRSRLQRKRGLSIALALNSSSIFLSIDIVLNRCRFQNLSPNTRPEHYPSTFAITHSLFPGISIPAFIFIYPSGEGLVSSTQIR